MNSTEANAGIRQWQPTPEEARLVLELLGRAEGYPRTARDGGRLRRVP